MLAVLLAARTVSGASSNAGDDVRNGLSDRIADFFDFVIGQIPSWIAAFVVFVLTIFVAKIAKNAVESRISDQIDEEHQEVLVLAGRMTFFGIMILGITVALKIAGIDLTTILAAVAFGIGFALRDLISNFIAGVMILVSRQFKIGDFLKIGSTMGKVMEIQTRATILKSFDGTKIIVPNSEIFSNVVISTTTNPFRRIEIPLYISYDTDIKYAIQVAMRVLKKHPRIQKKPGPTVIVKDYGDSSIDLVARFWVGSRDGWIKIKSDMLHKMYDAFNDAGIIIPYEVMHLETSQDTAEEWKTAKEIAKKKIEETALKKAQKKALAAAQNAPQNGGIPNNGQAQPVDNNTAAQPAPAPVAQIPPAPPLAAENVPVHTAGEYQDLEEIDANG